MKLSELFLNRQLYRDNNQSAETSGAAFMSMDSSDSEPVPVASGGAAQDVNQGNVMINSALIPASTIDIGDYGWTQSCAFTSDDADTVSWGAGTFIDAAGNSYSIDAGTTGNMAAKTYIYLSILDSETEYQKSTTSSDAVGVGKVLIAVAENESDSATFNLVQAEQIVGDNILVNTIDAGKITSGSITTTQLSFTPLYSSDGTGSVIATINASAEGINITADRIAISGDTTFAASYDPTSKVPGGGAAADVNANVTTISGAKIRTGEIDSTNYAYTSGVYSTAGMRIDLDDGSIRAKNFAIDSSGNAYFKGTLASGIAISAPVITGGSIAIGTGNAIFKADSNGIYLGNATFASAPFRVEMDGHVTASDITITGYLADGEAAADINANSTTVSGTKLTDTTVAATKMNVSSLSAITASLGTITSGTIKVSTRVGIQKSDTTAVAYLGQDPDSGGIWGFIANRGYGLMCRYSSGNYFRIFMDSGSSDAIIDLPSTDQLKFQDNSGAAIARMYGNTGWGGSPGGLFDLFHPMRLYTYDYGGGTSGGPEAGSYASEGMMYVRLNYGGSALDNIRVYVGGSWRSINTT